jgi:hypothetical protein
MVISPITSHHCLLTGYSTGMILLLALLLLLWPQSALAKCNQVVPLQTCNYDITWQWSQGEGGDNQGFILQRNGVDFLSGIPPDARSAVVGFQDTGFQTYEWRLFAFNAEGRSGSSNPQTTVSAPVMSLVTMITQAIVTTSRRSNDSSSVISILVNANTVIGPAGLVITYPPGITLLTSRRALSTSSVIAILVNKSTVVVINPDP